jgi:hypothetical protein
MGQTWFTAQANAAWNKRRTDQNITWNSWTTQTPSDDCGSLECLSAAVIQQVVPNFGSQPLANGTYKVINRNSGKSLEVASYGTANNSNIQQWGYVGIPSQKWTITATSGGYYSVKSVHSGKALDVAGVSTTDGANVNQWTYVSGNNQQWSFQAP